MSELANQPSSACPKCGRALSGDALRGLCPRCILAATLDGGPLGGALTRSAVRASLPRAFGSYELLEEVARGGMGIVYKARQPQVSRIVALKVLAAGQFASPDFVNRFRTEAEAVSSLDHPNIVPIYEVGECEGQPFFSMKFIEGGSLAGEITKFKSAMPNRQAAELIGKLARAIHYSHQHGILHRDIKPGNVLLDAEGEPHLTDFGLAKLFEKDSTLTRTLGMLGTPSYMSPEQAGGEAKQLTTAVDVYGLGAVFYELLTGQPPFAGGTTLETVRQVLDKEPRRPSALRPGMDRDLETICLKCLAKDPARRYGSAEALAADLKRWEGHEPILARPASLGERVGKWIHRHRLGFLAIITMVLLLLSGVTVSTWQAVRATKAEALANQRLYNALIREAQSIRTIRHFGFRGQLVDRIQQALAIPIEKKDMDVLRAEFAQCLGDALSLEPTYMVDPPPSFLAAALNSDGSLAAFGTAAGQVVLHETTTGQAIARMGHHVKWVQLEFAPDQQSLFGRGYEPDAERAGGAHRIWLIEWRRGADGAWSQQSERFMPDLRRLVVTTGGVIAVLEDAARGEVRLINAATDQRIGAIPLAPGQAFPAAFDLSSDHRLAACLADGGTNSSGSVVEVWDLQAGSLRARLPLGLGPIRHLDFSRDGRFLACTAETGVLAYETTEFKLFNQYLHYMPSRAVWCGDGASLAIPFSQENGVRLCSVISGTDIARLTTKHQVREVWSSLDGSVLLVTPITGTTLALRLTGTGERMRLTGHVGGVTGMEFSPDGSRIASTGKDGMIRIWDANTGKMLRIWPIPPGVPGQTVAFSPDGRWLVSGSYQNDEILVWPIETGGQHCCRWGEPVLALGDQRPGQTWTVAFSPDGKTLVSAGNSLRAWELKPQPFGSDGPPLQARLLFHEPGRARNLRIEPNGEWLGFQGEFTLAGQVIKGSFVRSLDPSGTVETVDGHRYAVQSLGIVDGGRTLLHRSLDQNLIFWDYKSRASVRALSTLASGETASTYIVNFSVSPDGSKLAAANHIGRGVNFYDVASGRRLYSLPDGPGSIWWLTWHPDGRHLAVSTSDGDISVWNLSAVEAVLAKVGLIPIRNDAVPTANKENSFDPKT